jgi:clan AA aspartic protease (TIGR02281 family)
MVRLNRKQEKVAFLTTSIQTPRKYTMLKTVIFFLSLSTLSIEARAERIINKCKNQQGEYIYQKAPCADNTESVTSWSAPVETTKVKIPVVLEQGLGGHYFLDSEVNGVPVKFVVDTGASVVSLPASIANAAKINCTGQIRMETANGSTPACTGVINKLKFGSFLLNDVLAAIVPNLGQPLLGMNILAQFKITQDGNTMKIAEH